MNEIVYKINKLRIDVLFTLIITFIMCFVILYAYTEINNKLNEHQKILIELTNNQNKVDENN